LGSQKLGQVLADLDLMCIDIGARGGITKDLLPIASSVDAIGFEPDEQECQRLNSEAALDAGPWRSLRYIPIALSETGGSRILNLTNRRGTSSMLQADPTVAEQFSRADYYVVDDEIEIQTTSLDSIVDEQKLSECVFIKIDVEGMEMEIFRSATQLLGGQLLGIRCEVAFIKGRIGQPSFGDIETYLQGFGFVPMGFPELHHWRRSTKRKHPIPAKGAVPYSKGQMAHGDVLFYRDPSGLADNSPDAIELLLKAAFLAMAFEHVDHAHAILKRRPVAEHLRDRYDLDPDKEISWVSHTLQRHYRQREFRRHWISLKGMVGRNLGLLD
jgi:FkbM family methyltransferase